MKPRAVAPKEKPANMTQQEWDEEKRRCSILTADRRWRRLASDAKKAKEAAAAAAKVCLSLGGTPSEAGSSCYPLTGRSMAGGVSTFSRSASPSSPAYFAEPPLLSQMRFSQMEGHTRYSPEYADADMIVDPNVTYSPASAPRDSNAFLFTVDLNNDVNSGSPDLRRAPGSSAGHVTNRTGLPRSLFSGDSRSAHHVFDSASGATMEDDNVNGVNILSG